MKRLFRVNPSMTTTYTGDRYPKGLKHQPGSIEFFDAEIVERLRVLGFPVPTDLRECTEEDLT